MGWKPVKRRGDVLKWDEAKILEGRYGGAEERTTQFGENLIHFLEAPDGEILSFFGTTQLNEDLAEIPEGELIRVEYTGKKTKTSKGYMVKEFMVYRQEDAASGPAKPAEEESPQTEGTPDQDPEGAEQDEDVPF